MNTKMMIITALMAAAAVGSFAAGDSIPVSPAAATDPADAAMDVPHNQRVSVIFREPMDPLTINFMTFTLQQRGMPVFGAVAYDGVAAYFKPAVMLAPATQYTARLTSGARSFSGAPLAGDLVWKFTTSPSSPQSAVNMASCQNFLLLAYSAITNTGVQTRMTGDIGLSPAAGSFITGIQQSNVQGTIYTVNGTGPAGSVVDPARLITARDDLTTAYNDAAGRTAPDVEYGVPADIGGMILTPGLYKFDSTLAISGSDLTLNGPASGVWIFQIASTLTVANGIRVMLTGGATAANIFWQVGTSATMITASHLEGTLMADVSITFQTGATLLGRALARTGAVTLDTFTGALPCVQPAPILNSLRAAKNGSNILLTWAASADPAFNHYNIYGAAVADYYPNGWLKLGETSFPSASDALASSNGYYLVSVVNNGGCESVAE